jgi:1-aminocyclopropane-1-carboxylate deaminase/D-cysteine desulfhydrase-like pyridoxal-dependent ACC family enzyme
VIGISADESAESLSRDVRRILDGLGPLLGFEPGKFADVPVEIDDDFIGDGYGISTPESRAAIELLARTEAIFLDPTYTAKAMAGLMAHVRRGSFSGAGTVLFWHTGGQVALFA